MSININYYLINLDSSTDRLELSKAMFDNAKIKFERISGIDCRGLSVENMPEYDESETLRYFGRSANGGEIGCYLSHIKAVKTFLESSADYAVILEDDAKISDDFTALIQKTIEYIENISKDVFLVNVGSPKLTIKTKLIDLSDHQALYRAHYFPMSAFALLWTRKGAEEFIKYLPRKMFCPIDTLFRLWLTMNDKGCAIYPPIAKHRGINSVIDTNNLDRKKLYRGHFYGLHKQKRLNTYRLIALKHKYYR